jgi:hypothetical protein
VTLNLTSGAGIGPRRLPFDRSVQFLFEACLSVIAERLSA